MVIFYIYGDEHFDPLKSDFYFYVCLEILYSKFFRPSYKIHSFSVVFLSLSSEHRLSKF